MSMDKLQDASPRCYRGRADDRLGCRLAKARTDGESNQTPDAPDLAALLLGPLLFRALMQPQEIDDAFITSVIDHALPSPKRRKA